MNPVLLAGKAAIALVAILLSSSAVFAQEGPRRGRRGPQTEQLEQHLGLTADRTRPKRSRNRGASTASRSANCSARSSGSAVR